MRFLIAKVEVFSRKTKKPSFITLFVTGRWKSHRHRLHRLPLHEDVHRSQDERTRLLQLSITSKWFAAFHLNDFRRQHRQFLLLSSNKTTTRKPLPAPVSFIVKALTVSQADDRVEHETSQLRNSLLLRLLQNRRKLLLQEWPCRLHLLMFKSKELKRLTSLM